MLALDITAVVAVDMDCPMLLLGCHREDDREGYSRTFPLQSVEEGEGEGEAILRVLLLIFDRPINLRKEKMDFLHIC